VLCGFAEINPIAFCAISVAAILPLAALSWFLVEKPALSWKSRLRRKNSSIALANMEDGGSVGRSNDIPGRRARFIGEKAEDPPAKKKKISC
ncbi:hypothetical protein, partial [Streptococcus pyogenes]|uniref:hypothetical protein n=1 Tax=Streptococcus pyogenes TaxID=1314 RepID=UPI000EEA52EA